MSMQETEPTIEPTEPVGAEVGGSGGEPAPQVDSQTLDLNEYGNYKVPVKVGGEERLVPVSEVVSGHMMHADYTRKTQELAQEREALAEARAIAEALQADPAGTLKVLEEWYANDDADLEEMDPLERQVHELQSFVSEQQRAAQDAALEAELNSFHERFGVDQDQLLRFAVENNIPNLEWAYATMNLTQSQAAEQLKQEQGADEAARIAAKQGAAFVEGGGDRSRAGSSVPAGSSGNVSSIADAFALAKQQLGA